MGNLFAKKSMDALLAEANEEGSQTLERSLGPFALTALGIGAVIGAGIFVLSGIGAHYGWPGVDAGVRFVWAWMRLCRSVLCGVRRNDPARGFGLHLCLRDAG